jgi:uncharacterized protein YndB with AHSA1/START domain
MRETRITRHLDAPRSAVFEALVDRDRVAQWRFPAGMTVEVLAFDARAGGQIRVSLTYTDPGSAGKTTAATDTYRGHFLDVTPYERVVEVDEFETDDPALRRPMTSTITLTDAADGGTDLAAVHEGLPSSVRPEDNELGWRESLDRLAALVENG